MQDSDFFQLTQTERELPISSEKIRQLTDSFSPYTVDPL